MSKYVTAETVSPGHPDKIADLISDYVLTKALENNKKSRVAVETFLTGTDTVSYTHLTLPTKRIV